MAGLLLHFNVTMTICKADFYTFLLQGGMRETITLRFLKLLSFGIIWIRINESDIIQVNPLWVRII